VENWRRDVDSAQSNAHNAEQLPNRGKLPKLFYTAICFAAENFTDESFEYRLADSRSAENRSALARQRSDLKRSVTQDFEPFAENWYVNYKWHRESITSNGPEASGVYGVYNGFGSA
jgi:hypothetical protein